MTSLDDAWRTLAVSADEPRPRIDALFGAEPDRLARMTLDVEGIHFDFAKQAVSSATLATLGELARAAGLEAARARLFAGAVVNPSEGRAATHWAERAADADLGPLERLGARVAGGAFGPVRHILHVGIGGSALGPALLLDAVRDGHAYDVAVVSNVDGEALARVFERFDPAATLLVIVSKTFTTLETMLNARTALGWMGAGAIERAIAVTAAPAQAGKFGIGADNVLAFPETIGGRYSLWSSVGASVALAWGMERWRALLGGAAAMDGHFRDAPIAANAPVLAGMIDVWNARALDHATRGVFPYDERLRLLAPFLQQLEMESNGKRVTADGAPAHGRTAPVTWGATGTDAQHAVFQLMHQGSDIVPAEFVGVVHPGHALPAEHHRQLLANMLAQGAALMAGRSEADALAEAGGDPALAAAKGFPGDRPSTTILLDQLTPHALGALLAFYEHRTFVAATLLGINPFDQWGVELGKQVANAVMAGRGGSFDPSTEALRARAGV